MRFRIRSCIILVALVAGPLALTANRPVLAQMAQPTLVSADPRDGTPQIQDGSGSVDPNRVNAVVQSGDIVVVGGLFTQVRNFGTQTLIDRTNLLAFSFSTGKVDLDFVPAVDGVIDAMVLAPDGQHVYIAGKFSHVNGLFRQKIAEIDIDTGAVVTGFSANANAEVNSMLLANGRLYVSGSFTTVRGVARNALAAVSPVTGDLDPNVTVPFVGSTQTGAAVSLRKMAVSPDQTRLLATGNFTTVGGLDRWQVAMLDLTTNPVSVANWETDRFKELCNSHFKTYTRDVDFSPDGSYFVIVTTGAYRANLMCDSQSRWETGATGSALQPTWIDWTGGDTSTQVAITGKAVYVGGHQRWENNPYRGDQAGPGAVPRSGIAALDPVNGLPYLWDPERDPRGAGVYALLATDHGLWVGSDTDNIGGELHQKIAFMPLDGGEVVPDTIPYTLPNDLYTVDTAGNLVRRTYNGSSFGAPTTVASGSSWASVRGVFALNGKLFTGSTDGNLYVQDFDGTNLGTRSAVNQFGLQTAPGSSWKIPGTNINIPGLNTQIQKMTGMFFDKGRLYYSVLGDPRLYYRYFTAESQIIGASLFVSAINMNGIDWSKITGMTLASGKLYFTLADNKLYSAPFSGGVPTSTPTAISGPGIDGITWNSRGLFAFNQLNDSIPPTQPGKPSGSSHDTSSIDLTWNASSDNISTALTYDVYRDGNPSAVGEFQSNSTTTVSFSDTGLVPGSTHTYVVKATDGANNSSPLSPTSDPITVLALDTSPPTAPGQPSGTPVGKTRIDLTWAASSDDRSSTLTYDVYRDGNPSAVGEFQSNSTTTVSFSDTGLNPGSTHTYVVTATDAALNTSLPSPTSDPIATAGNIFVDGFDSSDFSNWTANTRMTIDATMGGESPPSAQMNTTNTTAFAYVELAQSYASMCLSANVNVTALNGSGLDLLRFRGAGNAPLAKAFVTSTNKLAVRSEFAGTQKVSTTSLPAGWSALELCGTVGSATTWDLYLNGTKVVADWVADTGSTPITRVQIGDTASKSVIANWDDVVADQIPG